MRIIHVCLPTLPVLYSFGGAIQRRIIELASRQALDGNEVIVYSIGSKNEVVAYNGFFIHFVTCIIPLPLRFFEYHFKVLLDIARTCQKTDILHYHSLPEGSIFSHFLAKKVFLSYDYYIFRGGNKILYPFYKFFLRNFDKLLPVSNYCLDGSSEYWKLPKSKFSVIYNGVNLEQFHPDEIRGALAKVKYQITGKVILYVGRVCQQKGTLVLINAIELLNNHRNDIKLVIAGPINNFGTVEDDKEWTSRIHKVGGIYLGAIDELELSDIYNMADIFVMPTIDLEMFGMAAVEALACGRPVISSDHGGLKEIIDENVGGRFSVGNYQELANLIEKLIDNQDLFNALKINTSIIASKFNWTRICQELIKIYEVG